MSSTLIRNGRVASGTRAAAFTLLEGRQLQGRVEKEFLRGRGQVQAL